MSPQDRKNPITKMEAGLDCFHQIGGALAADFANTVVSREKAVDSLVSWPDLIDFFAAVGIVRPNQIMALKQLGNGSPEEIARTVETALYLRAGIREALAAIANRQSVPDRAAEAVNRILRLTEGYDQLIISGSGWGMQFVQREKRLEWLLAAIARSAANIIVEGRKAPVRKCGNPACLLYFYDTSRTGRRRWCSMAVCGNRNKVAAFTRRIKKKRG